jgi:transcriptional regulator with XRE-family HTH domain
MNDVGEVLDRIERESGMPRSELMRRADLSYATWIAWKSGRRRPSADSLRAVALVLRETGAKQTALADALETTLTQEA